jgi:hypothetical protein
LTGEVGLDGAGDVVEAVARLPMAGLHDGQNRLDEAAPRGALRPEGQLAPERGRQLFAAYEQRLADAVGPGRELFVGRIPIHLFQRLRDEGDILERQCQMQNVVAKEIVISPEAMEILSQFFHAAP